jgi:hypothetical protein
MDGQRRHRYGRAGADSEPVFLWCRPPDGSESELGSYSWNVVSHELVATADGGGTPDDNTVTLTADERGLIVC